MSAKAGFSSDREKRRVDQVMDNGIPELIEAMDKEEISITAAAELSGKPKDKQKECLDNLKSGKTAKDKSNAIVWGEKMDALSKLIIGVKAEYSTAQAMLDSPEWATSSKEEKIVCINKTKVAARALLDLSEEFESCKP